VTEPNIGDIKLCGYLPGAIGRVTELHATYYHKYWGFNLNFESQVATELSEFLIHFDKASDGFWVATLGDLIVCSVAINGSKSRSADARLRWFILAHEYRGYGIGKALMWQAINFCKQVKFSQVYLWTFAGLDPARYLYEQFGFTLYQEHKDNQWGNTVTHQMFKLDLQQFSVGCTTSATGV
jgi:GNAT superfamily N-acetyltransferase